MTQSATAEMIAGVQASIEAMFAHLDAGDYDQIPEFHSICQEMNIHLQSIPVGDVQLFSKELEVIGIRLGQLLDQMGEHQEVIRGKLDQADGASHAAKAYLKSSLASAKKKG